MFRYRAFGLGIRSEIELPELPESTSSDDLLIRRGIVAGRQWLEDDGTEYEVRGREELAFGHQAGWFLLRNASEIVVEQSPGSDPGLIRLVLYGRAFGAILQWRGRLVLHASAVARPGGAIAFAGPSGAGKSTLAAAMVATGWYLLTDEILSIDTDASPPAAHSGLTTHRLSPAAASLIGIPSTHELPAGATDLKNLYRAERHTSRDAVPLRAIFALEEGETTRLERLDPGAALPLVLANSYASRIIRVTESGGMHLTHCSRLLARVPVFRLVVNRSHSRPLEVASTLERELPGKALAMDR